MQTKAIPEHMSEILDNDLLIFKHVAINILPIVKPAFIFKASVKRSWTEEQWFTQFINASDIILNGYLL